MRSNRHIIKKINLNLTLSNGTELAETRATILSKFQTSYLNQFSQIMDELVDENTVIKIDRLVLDLGEVEVGDLPEKLMETLKQQLKINKQLVSINNPTLRQNKISELRKNASVSALERNLEAVLYYLKKGRFSWWSAIKNHPQLQTYVAEWINENTLTTELQKKQFVLVLKQNRQAFERFLTVLPKALQSKIIADETIRLTEQLKADFIVMETVLTHLLAVFKTAVEKLMHQLKMELKLGILPIKNAPHFLIDLCVERLNKPALLFLKQSLQNTITTNSDWSKNRMKIIRNIPKVFYNEAQIETMLYYFEAEITVKWATKT